MKSSSSCVVIIVNYNTSKQVVEAIKSLEQEDFFAIIVVDNASPNDHVDLISETYPSEKIVLLKNKHNVGFGEACNIGANYAFDAFDPNFILFLNPDAVVEPGLIHALSSPFCNPSIGVTTPLITNMNDQDKIWYSGGEFSWIRGSALVKQFGLSINEQPSALTERDVEFASGCCMMIRSDLFKILTGFDARFFMYEEDVELSLSVLKKGFRIRYVPAAVVRHIGQGSHGSLGNTYSMYDARNPKLTFFVYYTTRNRFLTILKHGNFWQRCAFYIGFPLWILRRGLPWVIHQRWDAIGALVRGISDLGFIKTR